MARNRAPSVNLTREQKNQIDEVVMQVVRYREPVRLGEILGHALLNNVLATLPASARKPDYRFVGEAIQRLKQDGKVELQRGRWRTTNPTA